MSELSNPFQPMIDLQRRTIEQNQRALHQGMEIENRANQIALESLETGRSLQQHGIDLVRTLVGASLDATAASSPGGDVAIEQLQEIVTEQFDFANEVNDQSWDALREAMEDNVDAFESFTDQSLDMADEIYEDLIDALTELEAASASSGEAADA